MPGVRTVSHVFLVSFLLHSVLFPSARGYGQDSDSESFSPFTAMGYSFGSGADLIALGDERWLFAGARKLQLLSGETTTPVYEGHLESLDVRSEVRIGEQTYELIAAIDVENGAVVIFLLADGTDRLERVAQVEFATAVPEALCLFRDPASANISLFTFDARGMLEQRYIYDSARESLTDLLVRRDVGAQDVQVCAVDDQRRSLIVADEQHGVRRFDAHEESDPTFQLWIPVEPFGDLGGEVENMTLDESGTLWILVPDAGRIYRQARDGEVQTLSMQIPTSTTAVAVTANDDEIHIALLDEDTGEIWQSAGPFDQVPAESDAIEYEGPAGVVASVETAPVRRFGDAADDPAILVDSRSTQGPLILGTDKREGLTVYSLDGNLLQFLPVGRLNNVDVIGNVRLGDSVRTLAAASNRTNGSVALFKEGDEGFEHLGDFRTGLGDVYGLCMYASDSGLYVFINDKSGAYEQYRVDWESEILNLALVRSFALPSQPEGCVADTRTKKIYMGEESAGVWMAGAEPDGADPVLIIPVGNALVADVEGMDIYQTDTESLLVVSSQGSDSFAVFDLEADYQLAAHFEVRANLAEGVDGVSETDGLAVTSAPLPGFPRGVLVVQDGRNRMPDAPQNFKLIDWRQVHRLFE